MLGEGQDWFLIIWALVCIVVVLGMSYWVTRFFAGRGTLGGRLKRKSGGQMEVLAQELLGKDQRLVIARVGDKYFLLGVTPHAISMLSEISWDETVPAEDAGAQNLQNNPSFFEAFSSVLKDKMRR